MQEQALILAAGKGTRLASLQLGVPKPMAPINGKPFLDFQLRWLKKSGIQKVVICISNSGNIIEKRYKSGRSYGITIRYSREKEPRGTLITIKKALPMLEGDFFIINGDTAINFNPTVLIKPHRRYQSAGTLALVRKQNVSRYGAVIRDNEGRITRFIEKGIQGPGLVYAGVMITNKEKIFPFVRKSRGVSFEHDVFTQIAKKGTLYGVACRGSFWDIGTPESYKRFISRKKFW